jgi:hypothetical protein
MVAGPQKVSVLLVSEGSKGAACLGCEGHPRHACRTARSSRCLLLFVNQRQQIPGCQEDQEEMKHTAVDTVSCHFVFSFYPRRQEFDHSQNRVPADARMPKLESANSAIFSAIVRVV